MKKLLIALLAIGLLAPFASADAVGGLITVSLYKYEPSPAEPGSYVDVWVNVANTKTSSTADEVSCSFQENYPFSLDASESAFKNIGQLKPGYDAVIKYKVRVDGGALLGNNTVKISCASKGYPNTILEEEVYVQPHDAVLSIFRVSENYMEPGKGAVITLDLKNEAQVTVKDISVKLDLEASTTPFAPVGSTSEKRLNQLFALEEQEVSFNILSYPTATPGVYKIPVTLTYSDWLGTEYTKEDVITLVLDSPAILKVNLESTEVYKANALGELSLEIVNKGLADVKFLTLTLLPSKGYTITSAEEAYLGELASDDSTSANYDFYVGPTDADFVTLLVRLSYTNAFNQAIVEEQEVELPLYTQDELQTFGIEQAAETNTLLVLVAIVIAGFIGYKLYKRFKKK